VSCSQSIRPSRGGVPPRLSYPEPARAVVVHTGRHHDPLGIARDQAPWSLQPLGGRAMRDDPLGELKVETVDRNP
jgi:hypothetical protein